MTMQRLPQTSTPAVSNLTASPNLKRQRFEPLEGQVIRSGMRKQQDSKLQFIAKLLKQNVQSHSAKGSRNGFFNFNRPSPKIQSQRPPTKLNEANPEKEQDSDGKKEQNVVQLKENSDANPKECKPTAGCSQLSQAANVSFSQAANNQENHVVGASKGQKHAKVEQGDQTQKCSNDQPKQPKAENLPQKQHQLPPVKENEDESGISKQPQPVKDGTKSQLKNQESETSNVKKVKIHSKPSKIDAAIIAYNMRRIQYNQTKCRFFPNCQKKNCKYYHPKIPCKFFPNCKSGVACMFLHKDCRYGDKCTSLKCVYTHPPLPFLDKAEKNNFVNAAKKAVVLQANQYKKNEVIAKM